MQFVSNGPDVPDRLLQAHEDGDVVFFAGSGISRPAGLPDFPGLVDRLFDALSEPRTRVQQEAIDRHQFDSAIDLLERSIKGKHITVRRKLFDILIPERLPPDIETHHALLTLSRTRSGPTRLITTNFDHLFEEAMRASSLQVPCFQAPLLPPPKRHWSGLMYLHGRLPDDESDDDLVRLVLSSGDFGRAYLTDRWASRFVSELFRRHMVCYVGYSITDSVLRYMMDALAADRRFGESSQEVFAFASYSDDKSHEEAKWRAKNVTPILYQDDDDHSFLHETLREWARTYRDGSYGKERIVVEHAPSYPIASTAEDDFVGRMLWALSDRVGRPANRFADLEPLPPLDWLDHFSDMRFGHVDLPQFDIVPESVKDTSVGFSLLCRPSPDTHWMELVHPIAPSTPLDSRMLGLARWLEGYLDHPRLLLWLAKRGGQLHPTFASGIRARLDYLDELKRKGEEEELDAIRAKAPHAIPRPAMRRLWDLLLIGRIRPR